MPIHTPTTVKPAPAFPSPLPRRPGACRPDLVGIQYRTHPASSLVLLNVPLVWIRNIIVHLVRRAVEHDIHVLIAANAHAAAFHHGSVAILVSLQSLRQPRIVRGLAAPAPRGALVRRQTRRRGRARGGRGARRGAAAADPCKLDRAVDARNGPVVELDTVKELFGRLAVFEGDLSSGLGGLNVGELANALPNACQLRHPRHLGRGDLRRDIVGASHPCRAR